VIRQISWFRRIYIGIVVAAFAGAGITAVVPQPPGAESPPPLGLLVMSLPGLFIILLLFLGFTTQIHARFDRAAGTVTIRGGRWLKRGFKVTQPLADVIGIAVYKRTGPRNTHSCGLEAHFRDGTRATIWTPLLGSRARAEKLQHALQDWLAAKA
jgi:hypothetical protein